MKFLNIKIYNWNLPISLLSSTISDKETLYFTFYIFLHCEHNLAASWIECVLKRFIVGNYGPNCVWKIIKWYAVTCKSSIENYKQNHPCKWPKMDLYFSTFFSAMVSIMDEVVKNVTDAFKKHGLWENTIMIFSTGKLLIFSIMT